MKTLLSAMAIMFGVSGGAAVAAEQGHNIFERQKWTFGGLFGYYDQAQVRRGYMTYKEVCASCHSMKLLSFRNLAQPGGPAYTKEEAEAFAKEATVQDGPNDAGDMFDRPGKLSDRFPSPFKNDKAAAAALGGGIPPDLSLIVKARTYEQEIPWYMFPVEMVKDMATQYEERGADYLFALLNGYKEAPADKPLAPGMQYNVAFPGNQMAMPQPLMGARIEDTDPRLVKFIEEQKKALNRDLTEEEKTAEKLKLESRDVIAFLAWASEPHMMERKKLGLVVLPYLLVLSLLLLIAKKKLWSKVDH